VWAAGVAAVGHGPHADLEAAKAAARRAAPDAVSRLRATAPQG
jgi:hypothetical protein